MPDDNNLDAPQSEVFANFKEIVVHALHRGLTIHPLKPRDKNPWLKGWPDAASKDLKVVLDWATRFPTSNYGVAANDEFCILESDDLDHLKEILGEDIPSTYTVQARPGRPHYYFKQTEASRAAGNLDLPGTFEFKQRNKYVVGEGSIHPKGPVYVCINSAPIVAIPDSIVEKLTQLKSGTRARVSAPAPAPGMKLAEGAGRQGFLMRTCAQIWNGEKTQEEMFDELQAINLANCEPPKEAHKVLSMVEWIMEREPNVSGAKPVLAGPKLTGPKRKGTAFDFVLAPAPGQFEGAFALGSVHLLIGSSGAGKTTFGIQMLQAQGRGEEFLGRASYRRQFMVVMQDRSEFELERTFKRMGIDKDALPYYAVTVEESTMDPGAVLQQLYERAPENYKPEIFFAEGLDMWAPDAVDMKSVVPVLGHLSEFAKHNHVAVIGTVGSPKSKPKERYQAPRDRAFGSAAWARRTDTILDISVNEETQERTVSLLLRNAKPQSFKMTFRNGLLEMVTPAIALRSSERTAADIAKQYGCAVSTVHYWRSKGFDAEVKAREWKQKELDKNA
jgi:hypothetical protein